MAGQEGLPGWLRGLMEETFFVDCGIHQSMKNIFCLYCCINICRKCVPYHRSHHRIQVRSQDGNAVVKFVDLKELIDCSQIRTYYVHAEEVIYLRSKPRFFVSKRKSKSCPFCGNELKKNCSYCSLTCKVEHMRQQGNDISSLLLKFDSSHFVLIESENLQMNVNDKPDHEVIAGDHNQITPDLASIDFVQGEGSSSGWSLSEIVESCKKK